MEALGLGLLVLGGLLMGIAGIVLLVKAFQVGILWGLGYVFVPFVSLIFVFMYWHDTKKPFFYLLGGFLLVLGGLMLQGPGDVTAATM